MSSDTDRQNDPPRRSFLAKCLAGVLGVVALAAPVAAGMVVLLDPLRRKSRKSEKNWIRIAALDQIPTDGRPHLFPVVDPAPRDKWNLYDSQPVGSVFITRTNDSQPPVAISSACPHLGCTFDYDSGRNDFVCPCHNGIFHVDGTQAEESTVSPRDLDSLDVRVTDAGDVEVNYKRFKGGIAEQVEV